MLNSAETTRASVITEFLRCIYKSFARKIFSRAGKSMPRCTEAFLAAHNKPTPYWDTVGI